MNKLRSADVLAQSGRSPNVRNIETSYPEPLEVNVIFTGFDETAAALHAAILFARGLDAPIRLHAAIVVPFALPLDRPQISVGFFEQKLHDVVSEIDTDASQTTINVYICRNPVETFQRVLRPYSVVVVGTRNRWRPDPARRIAKALRKFGCRVVMVPTRKTRGKPFARVKQGDMVESHASNSCARRANGRQDLR
jgi:hypothetical protein